MYKNQKTSLQQFKSPHDILLPRDSTPSYSPFTKLPFKRPFQPENLNRSMENRYLHSENNKSQERARIEKFDTSPTLKSKKAMYSLDKSSSPYFSLDTPSLRQARLPNYEPTRCSTNHNGIIRAYAANTNQGIVRDYNEDRVSIILNIVKPQNRMHEQWPRCSFFGVYDGHGGSACADFLRDNLHQFVIKEPDFPLNPYEALRKGFAAAESSFQDYAVAQFNKGIQERSGSCAIVALLVGDVCYIANVGDSRAVLCQSGSALPLSRDHKPCDELEQLRIQKAGGKIYQEPKPNRRTVPYCLALCEFYPGDCQCRAKLERFGGKAGVVVAEPELRSFRITDDHEFVVLACDGVFDKLSSREVVELVQKGVEESENIHQGCSVGVERVLSESIMRKTLDNVTAVVVSFKEKKSSELARREFLKKTVQQVLRNSYEDQENNPRLGNLRKEVIRPYKLI